MITAGSRDPRIRAWAIQILRRYGCRSRDYLSQAQAIHEWCQHNLLYVQEPGDFFTQAFRVLWQGGGDCDCHAVAFGALCETVCLPVRLRVLTRKGLGYHVYCEVRIPPRGPTGRWLPAETTMPVPLGWDPAKADPAELRRLV